MENYAGKNTLHNHSAIARKQVNKLIIAKLEYDAPEFLGQVKSMEEVVRQTVFTYTF